MSKELDGLEPSTGDEPGGSFDFNEQIQHLKFEYITDAQARRSLIALKLPNYLAVAAILLICVQKLLPDYPRFFVLSRGFHVCNLTLGCVLLAFMFTYYAYWVWRVIICYLAGKAWSKQRIYIVRKSFVRGSLVVAILVLFVSINAHVLARPSIWCTASPINHVGFIMSTFWNTVFALFLYDCHCLVLIEDAAAPDRAVRDQPWLYHWPNFLLWLLVEGAIVWQQVVIRDTSAVRIRIADPNVQDCTWGTHLRCVQPAGVRAGTACILAGFCVYWAFSLFFTLKAWRQVHARAYLDFKRMHAMLRLHVRYLLSFTLLILSAVLLGTVSSDACVNFALTWFGTAPMLVVLTGFQWMYMYLTLPRHPNDPPPKIIEGFQGFAWTEAAKPKQMEKRNSVAPADPAEECCMFCMETAIKLFYFSALMYDVEENVDHTFVKLTASIRELLRDVQHAMDFYALTDRCLFHDRTFETKVLVAWSDRTIVISARGSAAKANFISDAQMLLVPHPPARKVKGRIPRVHSGFLRTTRAGGINDLVVERVEQILCAAEDRSKVSVMLTGHSLGGAIATLVAYDVVKRCQLRIDQVMVYTYGCPRVGNRAFARDYNETVPDTWSIINDQDLVTRGMKLFGLYKRAGHRVIINSAGDLIVRPSLFEVSLMQMPFSSSTKHHRKKAYHSALHSVLRSQMNKSKRYQEGLAGVMELLEAAPIVQSALSDLTKGESDDLADQMRTLQRFGGRTRIGAMLGGSQRSSPALEAAAAAAVAAEVPGVSHPCKGERTPASDVVDSHCALRVVVTGDPEGEASTPAAPVVVDLAPAAPPV